jgi:hypothetical protein
MWSRRRHVIGQHLVPATVPPDFSRIDPRARLADVLARLPGHPANRVDELLPWNWQKPQPISAAA